MSNLIHGLCLPFRLAARILGPDICKTALRSFVAHAWPEVPEWSNITRPRVEESAKASVGSCVVPTFTENGRRKVVLAEAGYHYRDKFKFTSKKYMAFGGFIDLQTTPASSFVDASKGPESPRQGAVRELEEELLDRHGDPLFAIHPDRLIPMDNTTITAGHGEMILAIGHGLELSPDEINDLKMHISCLRDNNGLRRRIALRTICPASGKAEVDDVIIADLEEVIAGHYPLLHPDQVSLFKRMSEYYQRPETKFDLH